MKVLNEILANMYSWGTLLLALLHPKTFCFLTSFWSIKETFLQAHDSLVSLIIFSVGLCQRLFENPIILKIPFIHMQLTTSYDSRLSRQDFPLQKTCQFFPNKILLICVTRGFIRHNKVYHFNRVGNWTWWSPAPRTSSGAILGLGLTLASCHHLAQQLMVPRLHAFASLSAFSHWSSSTTLWWIPPCLRGLVLPANLFWLDLASLIFLLQRCPWPFWGGDRDLAAVRDGDAWRGTPLSEELQARRAEVPCLRDSTQFSSGSIFRSKWQGRGLNLPVVLGLSGGICVFWGVPEQSLQALAAASAVTAKIFIYNQGRPGPSTGFGRIFWRFCISFSYVPWSFFFYFFLWKGCSGKQAPREEMVATLWWVAGSPVASGTGCSEGLSKAMGHTKCCPAAPSSSEEHHCGQVSVSPKGSQRF